MELGDVSGAFWESAELNWQGGKLFLRQPSGGLPGLDHQQLLEVEQSLRCVHVSRFANGKEIKENSVVAAFPRMFSPKRSLCLRVHTL